MRTHAIVSSLTDRFADRDRQQTPDTYSSRTHVIVPSFASPPIPNPILSSALSATQQNATSSHTEHFFTVLPTTSKSPPKRLKPSSQRDAPLPQETLGNVAPNTTLPTPSITPTQHISPEGTTWQRYCRTLETHMASVRPPRNPSLVDGVLLSALYVYLGFGTFPIYFSPSL
jgi:hypothetical protein